MNRRIKKKIKKRHLMESRDMKHYMATRRFEVYHFKNCYLRAIGENTPPFVYGSYDERLRFTRIINPIIRNNISKSLEERRRRVLTPMLGKVCVR